MKKIEVKKKNRWLNIKVENLVFIGLIGYLVVLMIGQQVTLNRNMAAYEEAQKKIEQAQIEQEELNTELDEIGTDEYIEKKAREEFGYVKNDEIVFVVE